MEAMEGFRVPGRICIISRMKQNLMWIGLIGAAAAAGTLYAVAPANAATVASGVGAPATPTLSLFQAVLPLAATGGVALLKWLCPKLPKPVIPVLAPLLGAAGEILGYYAGLSGGNALLGAILGASGVFVREAYDQVRKTLAEEA